jgi:two-component system chemotaxis response regulator CheB
MIKRDIIVIGGSAGGIRALIGLANSLPHQLPATLFVVIHTAPTSPGLLPELLTRAGVLQAQHARNETRFEPGSIYIAPPNRHLLIDANGQMRLTHGPKENRFRPAIDPLFRSAALAFGPRVVGILLSGGLDDGVSGLAAIKAAGGLTIVQHPREAEVPTLPRNALRRVAVDHSLPIAEIAALLKNVTQGNGAQTAQVTEMAPMKQKELEIEVRQAEEKHGLQSDFFQLGTPSMLTCPECHGALLRLDDESILRFRCHTGHAFTADSLLAALKERVEDAIWNAVRAIEESAMLLGHMARHVRTGDDATAQEFNRASKLALARAKAVRQILSQDEEMPALYRQVAE